MFCLCIFESDTFKIDCPAQIFRKMMKYLKIQYRLLVYLTSFTVFFSGDIKKKIWKELWKEKLWKWPVNWSFSEFLFRPPDTKSEHNSRKSTNKKFWPQ